MDAFQVQMERANQVSRAKHALGEATEAMRVANSLTRALVDDGHDDIAIVDTAHIHCQNVTAEVARIATLAGLSGLPGGKPTLSQN